jgi:hypothetical protein
MWKVAIIIVLAHEDSRAVMELAVLPEALQ